ncbi:unnamed protein product [Lymnaea stagnalis]|uniref:Uncharacterized protein n=1 Tax=Lymnaea stagnalis TaxID=6523 RepID=A0AAV2H825_LYMST
MHRSQNDQYIDRGPLRYRRRRKYQMCVLLKMVIFILLTTLTAVSLGQKIQVSKVRQQDCVTKCKTGLLSEVDTLKFNSTITLTPDLVNQSSVIFSYKSSSNTGLDSSFIVDMRSTCTGIRRDNNYLCSKSGNDTFTLSMISRAITKYSFATVRASIVHYNSTELNSDTEFFPGIYEPTNAIGVLTINGKIINQTNCSVTTNDTEILVVFECIGPATPCAYEISLNNSTQIVLGENRHELKLFSIDEATHLIKIKYALCSLENEHLYMECTLKQEFKNNKLAMILTLSTGIPTITVFFFSIISIVRIVHLQMKRGEDTENSPEEAAPLNGEESLGMVNGDKSKNVLKDETMKSVSEKTNVIGENSTNQESIEVKPPIQVTRDSSASLNVVHKTNTESTKEDNQNEIISLKVKQEMSNSLIHAAKKGHVETVRMLLQKGPDLTTRDDTGLTALMLASKHGNFQIVEILLKNAADINLTDLNDQTPLMIASQNGHFDIAEFLIRHGAAINQKDREGMTSIMLAIQNKNIKIFELLLENGADWEVKDINRNTALMLAAQNGLYHVVEKLIELGAHVNDKNNNGYSPLMYALGYKHSLTAEILLKYGANPNDRDTNGNSALMFAAHNGLTNLAEMLIHKHASIKDTNNIGNNALILASTNGHAETVKMLIENGADINMKNKDGMTALMLASEQCHTNTVNIIIEKITNVRDQKKKKGKVSVQKLINDKTIKGQSSLMFASQKGATETVKLLLRHKASIDETDNDGFTSLMFASQEGHFETVYTLLKEGANINSQNKLGRSAVMYASQNGHTDVVEWLCIKGANINIKDNDGMTASIYAREKNDKHTVDVLLKHSLLNLNKL